jgi:hypothetical protein
VVLVGQHLYGSHEMRSWKCLEFATGAETRASSTARRVGGICGWLFEQRDPIGRRGLARRRVPDRIDSQGQFTLPHSGFNDSKPLLEATPPAAAAADNGPSIAEGAHN